MGKVTIPNSQCYNEAKFLKWRLANTEHMTCEVLTISPLSICCYCSIASHFLWPHGLQHAQLPCRSPSPGACSNSCPSNPWCHPTILSSVIPFSSCLQSFPASGSFPRTLLISNMEHTAGPQHDRAKVKLSLCRYLRQNLHPNNSYILYSSIQVPSKSVKWTLCMVQIPYELHSYLILNFFFFERPNNSVRH